MLTLRLRAKGSGFSLVELLIGIAIIGLLMATAIPSFQSMLANTQIRNMAESMQNGLQRARQEAVHRNAAVSFVFTGTAWSIGCVTVLAECPALIESKAAKEGTGTAVTVASSGGDTVTFDPFGRRTVPGGAAVFTLDIDSTALSATDSRDLRVTVNRGGSVRMCDPNVASATDARFC